MSSTRAAPSASGAYYAILEPNTRVHRAYGEPVVSERHRHRWELNAQLKPKLEAAGLRCSGLSPDRRLVEFIELEDHPFWVGTQAHPEFKSRPDRPHPLFRELVLRRAGPPRIARPASVRRRRSQLVCRVTSAPASVSSSRRSGRAPGIHLARRRRDLRSARRRVVRTRRHSLARCCWRACR